MAFLDETIRLAETAIETKFFFRKLGLPFDFASRPDDFPSKCFATAKEARGNLPNPYGIGSGFAFSCRNHALLFDNYLLRVELGIEVETDEMILDRLIGGLIRIATVAPKSFLIGGLAPDGRGFYGTPSWENHAAWCFAVVRGLQTAAVAPESQDKFRSIAGKWFDRLRRDKFQITDIAGKPIEDGDLTRADADMGPVYLAILLASVLTGNNADFSAYAQAADENERSRLGPATADASNTSQLLWRQAALTVIAQNDPDVERAELAKRRLAENAGIAAKRIPLWREWDQSLLDCDVDFDWRSFPKPAEDDTRKLGFIPHESWNRLFNERTLQSALDAMTIVLLSGDAGIAEAHAEEMERCLSETPWDKVLTLPALAPAPLIHAHGVELGLWDKGLYDSRHDAGAGEISLAAKYLEPDYDEKNPDKAGHRVQPPGKKRSRPAAGDKQETGGKRRKRRRRK